MKKIYILLFLMCGALSVSAEQMKFVTTLSYPTGTFSRVDAQTAEVYDLGFCNTRVASPVITVNGLTAKNLTVTHSGSESYPPLSANAASLTAKNTLTLSNKGTLRAGKLIQSGDYKNNIESSANNLRLVVQNTDGSAGLQYTPQEGLTVEAADLRKVTARSGQILADTGSTDHDVANWEVVNKDTCTTTMTNAGLSSQAAASCSARLLVSYPKPACPDGYHLGYTNYNSTMSEAQDVRDCEDTEVHDNCSCASASDVGKSCSGYYYQSWHVQDGTEGCDYRTFTKTCSCVKDSSGTGTGDSGSTTGTWSCSYSSYDYQCGYDQVGNTQGSCSGSCTKGDTCSYRVCDSSGVWETYSCTCK